MAKVIIDGTEYELPAGQKLNGIQAARLAGVDIPHYCWHAGLSVVASCRMCLCETGTRDPATGKVTMLPKLVPACQTPATDNTVFVTDSEKIRNARAMVEEDLLIDHPIDCPICDKAGECHLQDYHFEHGRDERRADLRPFTSRKRPMGETVTLFVDRCVMCTRCVRFTREIAGASELMVINRGAHEEIDIFPGHPLANKMSGCVVDLCPVGALGDKDFLYQQRVWFMKKHDHVCGGCSTGCSITVEENQDQVYRLKPRENPHINQWWMCDEGRYGYHHIHSEKRLTSGQIRSAKTGELETVEWAQLVPQLDAAVRNAMADGRTFGLVLSPHLTVEEAYLLIKYLRGIGEAQIALGPVPVEGKDESFKNGFTIRAEKCPNRRGIEELIRHFESGRVATSGELQTNGGGVWYTGGYKTSWNDAAAADEAASARPLIVQDLFDSPLAQVATFRLPAAAFAERAGSFVNHAGRLQSFKWAVRPPVGVWTEGQLCWRLLNRPGLYNPAAVLQEIAAEIPYFAAAAHGVPSTGVQLTADKPTPQPV